MVRTGSSIVVAPDGISLKRFEPLHLRDQRLNSYPSKAIPPAGLPRRDMCPDYFRKWRRDFVDRVKREVFAPATSERGPYPNDAAYLSATRAEFDAGEQGGHWD
jgi:hypothetical protein